jgi:hypothetical protein
MPSGANDLHVDAKHCTTLFGLHGIRSSGHLQVLGFIVPTVPMGLSSVIPQACNTATPYASWNLRNMAGVQAAPPMMVRFMLEKFWPVAQDGQQALPDSRNASGERDLLGFEQSYSDLPSKAGPGIQVWRRPCTRCTEVPRH